MKDRLIKVETLTDPIKILLLVLVMLLSSVCHAQEEKIVQVDAVVSQINNMLLQVTKDSVIMPGEGTRPEMINYITGFTEGKTLRKYELKFVSTDESYGTITPFNRTVDFYYDEAKLIKVEAVTLRFGISNKREWFYTNDQLLKDTRKGAAEPGENTWLTPARQILIQYQNRNNKGE